MLLNNLMTWFLFCACLFVTAGFFSRQSSCREGLLFLQYSLFLSSGRALIPTSSLEHLQHASPTRRGKPLKDINHLDSLIDVCLFFVAYTQVGDI